MTRDGLRVTADLPGPRCVRKPCPCFSTSLPPYPLQLSPPPHPLPNSLSCLTSSPPSSIIHTTSLIFFLPLILPYPSLPPFHTPKPLASILYSLTHFVNSATSLPTYSQPSHSVSLTHSPPSSHQNVQSSPSLFYISTVSPFQSLFPHELSLHILHTSPFQFHSRLSRPPPPTCL